MPSEQSKEERQNRVWQERLEKRKGKPTGPNEANVSVLELLQGLPRLKVLDVGCGAGDLMAELQKLGHETEGLDISETALQEAKRRGLLVHKVDLDSGMPFPAGSFGMVTSVQVLQHVLEPKKMLSEMHRVSGKYLCLNLPNHLHWRNRLKLLSGRFPEGLFGTSGHIRLFSLAEARSMLEAAGFRILKTSFTGNGMKKEHWPAGFASGFSFLCEKKDKVDS